MSDNTPRITLICCYNNEEKYSELIKSAETQTIPLKIIGIDNRDQKYKSAASALNAGIKQVSTGYVGFVHQDILLSGEDTLEHFVMHADLIPDLGILGVAGKREDDIFLYGNLRHGEHIDALRTPGKNITGVLTCQTVDECFFGGKTEFFRENPFDEALCNGWHLYAAEICLRAIKNGKKVFICDAPVIHLSGGNPDKSYLKGLKRLAKAYENDFEFINTTCGWTRTKRPGRDIDIFKTRVRNYIIHHTKPPEDK